MITALGYFTDNQECILNSVLYLYIVPNIDFIDFQSYISYEQYNYHVMIEPCYLAFLNFCILNLIMI